MMVLFVVLFFKQKTAYEMRISDWSSDVCSSDLQPQQLLVVHTHALPRQQDAEATEPNRLRSPASSRSRRRTSGASAVTWRRTVFGFTSIKIGRASCRERVCPYV